MRAGVCARGSAAADRASSAGAEAAGGATGSCSSRAAQFDRPQRRAEHAAPAAR